MKNILRNGKADLSLFHKFNKKNPHHGKVKTITNEEGVKIEDEDEMKDEFKNHYVTLLQKREAETPEEKEDEELVNKLISSLVKCTNNNNHITTTPEDVEEVVKTLKKKKAQDATGWRNEHMIFGGREMSVALAKIFTMIDRQKRTPKQWEMMKIKSLFKEGKKMASNTRGLFITSVVSKVKEKTIRNRNTISSSIFQLGGKKGVAPVDHTLVMLEMINRNRYLGCDTYLVFVDMQKCFDKLWLEDGVLELWRSGMDATDARIILEMNKTARATLDTPVGMIDEIVLKNVCKQGTVYAVLIGCKTMERINGIGGKATTCFGPKLQIESLTYVDDIAGGGRKSTIETTIENCRVLEERKKAYVNLEKSKWMKIGKCEKTTEMEAEVKAGKMLETSEYKHLGTWVNNKDTYKTNIEKRKCKGEAAVKRIMKESHPSKVGKQEVPLKIALFTTVYIPTLLYNMEGRAKVEKGE